MECMCALVIDVRHVWPNIFSHINVDFGRPLSFPSVEAMFGANDGSRIMNG